MKIIFSKFTFTYRLCVNPDCSHKGNKRHRIGAGELNGQLYKAFMCTYCYGIGLEIHNERTGEVAGSNRVANGG